MAGISAVLGVGYFYGILRANVPHPLSHFIFDAAVVGLYATQLWRPPGPEEAGRTRVLRHWVALLIGWPLLMLILPIQDPMVQLVGLRAHVFFLPFLLLGARLDGDQLYRLALAVAGLNLVAFGFAVAEFFLGVPYFYPENEVTALIYRSNDIRATGDLLGAFRIPAIFANSHQYGATMTLTLPLLLGAWLQKRRPEHQVLLLAAIAASVLGVFFSATRVNLLMLGMLVLASLASGRMGVAGRVGWVAMLAGMGWVVSTNERLFLRLMSLNVDTIVERISWSVNVGVFQLLGKYPMGNGLGGGGSSMPHFLQHLIRTPLHVENQYATIMLEQGLPGLLFWFGFIAWVLTRKGAGADDPWFLGRRLSRIVCAAFLVTGFIGVGLFTSVPGTPLLLLWMAWIAVPQRHAAPAPAPARAPFPWEGRLAYRRG